MSSYIRELFHGSHSRRLPHHYYDDAMVAYGPSRQSMLPDVQLKVPMDSMRDVERVKYALSMEGVHAVVCDLVSQTVTVSGNVPAEILLRCVKRVKRHSHILSFITPSYDPYSSGYGSSSSYGSSYNRPYGSSRHNGDNWYDRHYGYGRSGYDDYSPRRIANSYSYY